MGSPWRDKISLAILELQEKGEIQILYDKWWKSPKDVCSQKKSKGKNKANSLGVDNIGGVFVVLLCGLAFAVLVAILEFCHSSKTHHDSVPNLDDIHLKTFNCERNYLEPSDSNHQMSEYQYKNEVIQRQSLFTDMTDELCFAIRCKGSRQRTALKHKCEKCYQIQQQLILSQRQQ